MCCSWQTFEKFRATCSEHYGLDAAHYYTATGLAWNAALRMSRVSLELINDVDMYHFVENGIQDGISMITTRHAQANSPSFPDTYDASLPNLNRIYLDASNLYGWEMSQPLPTPDSDSSGRIRSRNWDSYPMMLKMDIYLKWISATLIIYKIRRTTTHSPES